MFGLKPRPQRFWKWFLDHEDMLFDFEKDQERVFNQLAKKLHEIDEHLTFEFGPKRQGRRDFVLSADGVKKAFPAVISLVKVAPQIARWNVIGFRPRRNPLNHLEIRGFKIDPADVQFSLLDNGKDIGVYLFFPRHIENEGVQRQMGYLLLDEALGEFDVETKVGLIKFLQNDGSQSIQRHPLIELPELFDQHVLTLQRRNGMAPSQPN